MTVFRYEAISSVGATIRGTIEADSLPSALALLNQRGVRPYLTEQHVQRPTSVRTFLSFGKPGLEWRAQMIRQLATLLAAGITLDRSLLLLTRQSVKATERNITQAISKSVNGGQALSIALSNQHGLFKPDEVGLIKAGEQTGSLVLALEELASLMERRIQLRGKLVSALVYPAFLLAFAPVSLIIIATVLVPNLAPLFENSGAAMPFVLQSMIWFSTEIRERGLLWMMALFCIILFILWLRSLESVVNWWSSISLQLPFTGTIKQKSEAARICRTLGSLIRSGAPLQSALQALVDVTTSKRTQQNLTLVREKVSSGQKLGNALKLVRSINPISLQMISIGEETNKLDTMLLYVADGEEKALSNYVDRLMTLLTPLLTVALGLLVGGIVMSIMRAILSVNELITK